MCKIELTINLLQTLCVATKSSSTATVQLVNFAINNFIQFLQMTLNHHIYQAMWPNNAQYAIKIMSKLLQFKWLNKFDSERASHAGLYHAFLVFCLQIVNWRKSDATKLA